MLSIPLLLLSLTSDHFEQKFIHVNHFVVLAYSWHPFSFKSTCLFTWKKLFPLNISIHHNNGSFIIGYSLYNRRYFLRTYNSSCMQSTMTRYYFIIPGFIWSYNHKILNSILFFCKLRPIMIYLSLIISANSTWCVKQSCHNIFFNIMYLGSRSFHTVHCIFDMRAIQFHEFAFH